jgi:peptidoglycan/LPS O-acetylase OafA/YrhL
MVQSDRLNTLDGMRGIAAIAVMLHHFSQHTSQPIFASAGIAVDLFFCLSGFVIAHAYLGKLQSTLSGISFLKKRLIRLYPMYLLGFALGAPALIAKTMLGFSTLNIAQTVQSMLLNLFYLPYSGHYITVLGNERVSSSIFPVNDPAWSLFFELAVNIALAFWVTRHKHASTFIRAPLILIAVSGMSLALYTRVTWAREPGFDNLHLLGGLLRTTYGFFSGVVLYGLKDRFRRHVPVVHPFALYIVLLAVLALPNFGSLSTFIWLFNALLIVPMLVVLGIVSSTEQATLTRVSDYLGWLSYPVYCLHFPIYVIFTLITANRDYGLEAMLICTPIALTTAHILTKVLEEPTRAWLASTHRTSLFRASMSNQ